MKKLFPLILLLSASCVFTACSKEDEEVNPLIGTLWVCNEYDFIRYIEFIDDINVQIWNESGHYLKHYYGTYTVKENYISFSNLIHTGEEDTFIDATFTPNTLRVRYEWTAGRYRYYNYMKINY